MKKGVLAVSLSYLLIGHTAAIAASKDRMGKVIGLVNPGAQTSQQCNTSTANTDVNDPGPDVAGNWVGHAHSSDIDCSVTLELKKSSNKLEGSLTSTGKEGTAKHYLQGNYDKKQGAFVFRDVGLDLQWGVPGFSPAPIERYELHLVEEGTKLVGSCHQSQSGTVLWISLLKQGTKVIGQAQSIPSNPSQTYGTDSPSPQTLPPPSKHDSFVENDPGQRSMYSRAIRNYVKYVDDSVMNNYRLPNGGDRRNIKVHFTINKNGTVTNLRLDAHSGALDEFSDAVLNAVRAASPFIAPPQEVLEAIQSDHVDVCTPIDIVRNVTPETVSYMTYVQHRLKSRWHPPRGFQGRTVRVIFKIGADGSVSDLRLDDPSNYIDAYAQAAFNAVNAASPFMPPSNNLLADEDGKHVSIKFTFDYNARQTAYPGFLPFGRGLVFW